MTSPTLEDLVYAYHIETEAPKLRMVPRFWPYSELLMLLEDKVQLAVRPFGREAVAATKAPTKRFLDALIESGGFSLKKQDFGGTMHQYQEPGYIDGVRALQDADPIVAEARQAGPEYWTTAFTEALAAAG